jgi:Na+/H+ antiporter NhaD/arsenite permease-like protein
MAGDMAFAPARIDRPWVMLAYLAVLAVMIILFVFGETLPNPIAPPAVALVGAALVLLIAYWTGLDRVRDILRDVDWETLLFFVCIFVLVGALEKTGVIGALGKAMGKSFGSNVVLASLLLLGGIGILSSIIPNIPGGDGPVGQGICGWSGAGDAGCDRGRLRANPGGGAPAVFCDVLGRHAGR